MRRTRLAGLLGTTLVALMAAFYGLAYNAHNGVPFRQYRYVTAAFADVSGLRPGGDVRVAGGDVRVAGVRVGQVRSVSYQDGQAHARLQLPGGFEVHDDATATIRNRSALGQKFLELDPGTADAALAGRIPASRTKGVVEVDAVLDAFDPRTRQQLASTVRQLGQGTAGHQEDLNQLIGEAPGLLTGLGTATRALAEPGTDLAGLLSGAERVAARFTGREAELTRLVGQLDATLSALHTGGGGALRAALDRLPATLDATRASLASLDGLAADARQALGAAAPGLAALGQATPELRGALREAVSPLRRLAGASPGAASALERLTPLFGDLRPIAPRAGAALASARRPLEVLAPYAPEIADWFSYARSVTARGDANGNWLRWAPMGGADTVGGSVPGEGPLTNRHAYPRPGQAPKDAATTSNLGDRR